MTLNKQLLADVVNHLITHPETHNRERYHCGTSHRFAGLTQVLAHGPMDQYPDDVMEDAAELLGLSKLDAHYLFASERTVSEIHRRASRVISEDSCDEYDKRGYDEYGYDQYGRDQDGVDRRGYGLDGYDLDGYGRDGYGRDDRDRRGYDRNGYGRDGYDQYGIDQNGNSLPLIVVD